MRNYNDGEWHKWGGQFKNPVHDKSLVDQVFHNTEINVSGVNDNCHAIDIDWTHILMFRVVKEHREPRVFWVKRRIGTLEAIGLSFCNPQDQGAFKVIEVIE